MLSWLQKRTGRISVGWAQEVLSDLEKTFPQATVCILVGEAGDVVERVLAKVSTIGDARQRKGILIAKASELLAKGSQECERQEREIGFVSMVAGVWIQTAAAHPDTPGKAAILAKFESLHEIHKQNLQALFGR